MLQIGSVVEYESATKGSVQAVIVNGPNADGTWDLDVKRSVPPSRIRCSQSYPSLAPAPPNYASAPPMTQEVLYSSPGLISNYASAPPMTQEVLYSSPGPTGRHRQIGTLCFYKSASRGWIPARVKRFCHETGTYDLDCKVQAAIQNIFWIDDGTYVDFFSTSQNRWIPARVLRVGMQLGTFDLDCKEGVDIQRLRPRGGNDTENPNPATLEAMPGMMCYFGAGDVGATNHQQDVYQNCDERRGQQRRGKPGLLTQVIGPKPSADAGLLTRVLGPKPSKESGILERVFGTDVGLFKWGAEDSDNEDIDMKGEMSRMSKVTDTQSSVPLMTGAVERPHGSYNDVPLMTGALGRCEGPPTDPQLRAPESQSWQIPITYTAPPTDPQLYPHGSGQTGCESLPPLSAEFQQQSFRVESQTNRDTTHKGGSTTNQLFSAGGQDMPPTFFKGAPAVGAPAGGQELPSTCFAPIMYQLPPQLSATSFGGPPVNPQLRGPRMS